MLAFNSIVFGKHLALLARLVASVIEVVNLIKSSVTVCGLPEN